MDRAIPSISLGLTSEEAATRLLEIGPNSVVGAPTFRPLIAFFAVFKSPLLLVLLVTATISFFLGQRTSAVIIYVMVLVSGVLDFYNTFKSEKAAAALASRVKTTATVVRDGHELAVPLASLVPGDIVKLSAGSMVPADCVVLEDKDFFVDQSTLTGESFPVEKDPDQPVATQLPAKISTDTVSHLFMGTTVVTGRATAVVSHTGVATQFGQISASLSADPPPTDFEKGISDFSLFIMKVALVMVAFVFIANTLMGRGALESFLFAIAVAVGVTPELLPVIMTVSLSHGALKMAKKQVIVKKLPAIQSFGSMTVLCTDKTGTLTKDHIALIKYLNPAGEADEKVLYSAYLTSVFHTGVNNPLDTAIADFRNFHLKGVKKVDEIPFDFTRKRSSMVVDTPVGRLFITKGAPEDVMAVCKLTTRLRHSLEKQYDQLSNEGYRVLMIAQKTLTDTKPEHYSGSEESGLTLLGLVAFLDPPKADVGVVVRELEDLGVTIKIITGDSELLTAKIAHDLELPNTRAVTGHEIATMSDKRLQTVARQTAIFARVTPDQKERIIRALKADGQVVGYMGDGINDAPALRVADVSISVNNAVDIAKETADIILLRKSLSVLRDGILEGRKTFHNSMKYIMMGLSSNFGNMFSMMAISAFAPFLPMLPVQILLNNFLYDMSQTTIPSDHVDAEVLRRPPQWDLQFIRKFMLTFGPVSSLFDFATFAILLWGLHFTEHAFQTGWFIESLTTQVLVVYVIRTRKIPLLQSWPSRWLVASTSAMVGIGWIIPHTAMGRWFGFTALPVGFLWIIAAIVIVYLISAEIVKRIFYRRSTFTDATPQSA